MASERETDVKDAVRAWWDDCWSKVRKRPTIDHEDANRAAEDLNSRLQSRWISSAQISGIDLEFNPGFEYLVDLIIGRIAQAEAREVD